MIADKIIPSFYLLEISGDAVNVLVSGDYGIDKIAIGSFDFATDMQATYALQQAMQSVVDVMATEYDQETFLNPEFFPTVASNRSEAEESELEEAQAISDVMTRDLVEKGQVPVIVTNTFDKLGDFIQSRWVIEGDNFSVIGRIAANPTKYMMHKGVEQVLRHEAIDRDSVNKVAIH